MRRLIKHTAELVFAGAGPAAIGRRMMRGRTLVLAYHNILPEGAAGGLDRSLHLSQFQFARQLDYLSAHTDIVPLSAVLQAPYPRARLRVAISFDDGYRGALSAGLTELRQRGLPATMFIAPGFIGDASFWWDELAGASGEGLSEAERQEALERCRGVDADVRTWASTLGIAARPAPPLARCITEREVLQAAGYPGLSFGVHTWSHPNLARLGRDELDSELSRPLAWLQARLPRVLPLISYPYGLASTEVERAAAAAGYSAGFRVTGGSFRGHGSGRYALPRFNVPSGISLSGFSLFLAGLYR
jgi:peptidoglycan/xylan/chitin deacetylase (PgdA/CDA1 family)